MSPEKRKQHVTKEANGLTGEIRFRRQLFTGKHILQVARRYIVRTFTYTSGHDPYSVSEAVEWEDATSTDAALVALGMPPFTREKPKLSQEIVDQFKQALGARNTDNR